MRGCEEEYKNSGKGEWTTRPEKCRPSNRDAKKHLETVVCKAGHTNAGEWTTRPDKCRPSCGDVKKHLKKVVRKAGHRN